MKQITLYKYLGEDNSQIISPVKLPMEHTEMRRLIADPDKILTNGKKTVKCIDIESVDLPNWSEIEE